MLIDVPCNFIYVHSEMVIGIFRQTRTSHRAVKRVHQTVTLLLAVLEKYQLCTSF